MYLVPLMAKAAQDYLPILSAEVGIEHEFSNARDVLGLRRHCLNAETMRWLMLLKGQYQKQRSKKVIVIISRFMGM